MGLTGSGWGRRGRGSSNPRMTWGSIRGEECSSFQCGYFGRDGTMPNVSYSQLTFASIKTQP